MEWRDPGGRDFKAIDGPTTYYWFFTCGRGCSLSFTSPTRTLDRLPYAKCPYDESPLRKVT